MFSSLFCLYTVSTGQWIFKDSDFRRSEGKDDKEQGNRAKRTESHFRGLTRHFVGVQEPCFVEICDRGGNKENGDVDPVGRLADHTVVGVEDDGDQNKPTKNSAKLYAPKILSVFKKEALYYRKNEGGPKEKLYVLPR